MNGNMVEVTGQVKNEEFAEVLITKVLEKLMGQTLDIMRIGITLDRAFNQAERNTRQNFNTARNYLIHTLKEHGYLQNQNHMNGQGEKHGTH
jgi:hypothetical protein